MLFQQILNLLVAGFNGKVGDFVTPLPFHQAVFFQCVAKAQITVPSCGFVGMKGAEEADAAAAFADQQPGGGVDRVVVVKVDTVPACQLLADDHQGKLQML